MPQPEVTVVVPTLAADSAFLNCVRALEAQTYRDFDVIVVDNSGKGLARRLGAVAPNVRFLDNERNVGFGAAINQGWRESKARWIAALNDDAQPAPDWLGALVRAGEASADIGMVASQVRLNEEQIDSVGMLIAADGSSRQRGHRRSPSGWTRPEVVLLPSGSAAAYRRSMLDDTGAFDESFFLYCEDTDLGLRAAWRGWRCVYAPEAVVDHRYSHSAGRASSLKAWYVERNRLRLVIRNFPMRRIPGALLASLCRYAWHAFYMVRGTGTAAQFTSSGGNGALLPWYVLKAHIELLVKLPELIRQRSAIRRSARITAEDFCRLLDRYRIRVREVAAL